MISHLTMIVRAPVKIGHTKVIKAVKHSVLQLTF